MTQTDTILLIQAVAAVVAAFAQLIALFRGPP
jgi:hypothetical protein